MSRVVSHLRRLALGASVVALLGGAAMALPTPAGAASSAGFTLSVGIVSPTGVVDGLFGWGHQSGLLASGLKAAGVDDVQFTTFANGPDLNAALESGAIDVASMGDLPALEARAQGFATRLLAISSVSGSTWIIAKKGGPTTLSGLAGGSLGSPPGTAPYRYAYELLEERGLLSKVTISPLQTPNGVAALESGQIDAFSAPQPYAAELAAEGYPVLDKESSHPNLLATGEIVTTQTFLDAHRKFVPSFDRTYTSIVANIDAHAAGFYSYEAFVEGLPLAVAKQAYPVSAYPATPLIASGITLLGSTLKFALSLKLVTNTFDLKAWPVSPK